MSYGSAGGARAVEHLRLVMAEMQVADVRAQVMLSLATDFENYTVFKPGPQHAKDAGHALHAGRDLGRALQDAAHARGSVMY